MSAGQYRLLVDAGASFSRRIRPCIGDDPIDLTGMTVSFVIRDSRADWLDDLSDSVTVESDGIHINLTPAQTKRWTSNHRYYAALDLTSADGTRKRYLEGPLFVRNIGSAR